ncbi:nicotinate-nucleotide pyrophosphorylase (quinolinate phosphoribosyltransferase) [Candidatus Hydrogenisulfobacillus filiaventi]|uniref:Probable nicotinate-nucleotide pyrophosphorylase [carboxylating] n=1 Tax=Candidatus Hydrogenisulfobacillus filiaventi TaxID=2707344 RepID=A0A6F8ZJW8_9FIRM|nr:nicotinate-nucleotide pyrophosphorylase (quinolinate phosphoribosyltransferase) [Candidatus Hydrogenisulfobacillus filiaventi]
MLPARWIWEAVIDQALREDIGHGDVTTLALIPPEQRGRLRVLAEAPLVVAGLPALPLIFAVLGETVTVTARVTDGTPVAAGAELARLEGPARALLTGERVALNLIEHLSGISTFTRRVVEAVAPWGTRILDTRKTTPGLRALEKYAVRVGGGTNHRMGLDAAVLIKDNHIAAVGSVAEAVRRTRAAVGPTLFVEVECDSLEQVAEALEAGPDGILLDNMTPPQLQEAVHLIGGRVFTEASGGVSPANVAEVAATGVDAISLGALTHSAPWAPVTAEWEDLP